MFSGSFGKPFQENNFFKKIYFKRNRLKNGGKVKIKKFTIIKAIRVLILSLLKINFCFLSGIKKVFGHNCNN